MWNQFYNTFFKLIIWSNILSTFWEIIRRWVQQNPIDNKSALVQERAWCCQAASLYLSQCWPSSMSPYGITSRAETIRDMMHDTIRYVPRYICHSFTWEAEACDPSLLSEALHSTYYDCLRSNDAKWLQQWRTPRSFQMQCVCDEFTHFIGIYW